MASNQAERPQFYEGQYLGAADLAAVVEHARLGRARHDLGAHTWGIAAGLQLQEQAVAGGQFDAYVLPGYAWDGFGRPIVVLAPYKIPAELFKAFVFDPAIDNGSPAGRLIEVWLRYEETPTQGPRPGFELCDPKALFARVQETFRVEIGQRGLAEQQDRIAAGGYALYAQEILQQFEPQTPPAVLHDASVAFQQLPAAGERKRWLIPLGVVRWLPNATTGQPGSFVRREPADLAYSRSLRRYIGVVAGVVQAADKNIRLRDRTKPYSTVLSDDLVWAEGHVRVEGDTRLFGGKLEWRTATGQDAGVPLDIRRASDASNNTKLQVAIGAAAAGHNRFAVGPLIAGATPADPKVVDEKFVVLDNGNVGIGTTTPITKLEIVGNWNGEEGALRLTGDKPTIRFTGNAVSGNESWLLHLGSDGPGNLVFFRRTGPAAWANIMTLTPAGNVGIGTPNPGAPLHVANYMTVGPFTATDGVGGIDVTGPVAELGFVKRTLTAWPNPPAPGDRFVWYNPDGTARLWTNSTDLLTVTTAGNVGIGTTAPAFKLDVVDRIRVRQGGTGSAGIWLFQTGPNSDRAFVGMATDNHVGLWGNTGAQWGLVMNTDNGNVGIGTLAPAFRLDVADRIRVRQGGRAMR